MRKISAHCILPVSGPPIRNGIIHLDQDDRILGLEDPEGNLRETSRLEFYNGIIVPGFVLPFHDGLPPDSARDWGIMGLGISLGGNDVLQDPGIFDRIRTAPCCLHVHLFIGSGSGTDAFEAFHGGITLCSRAWNEHGLSCAPVPDADAIMEGDLPEHWMEFLRTHPMALPMKENANHSLPSLLRRLAEARERVFEDAREPSIDILLQTDPDARTFVPGATPLPDGFNIIPVLRSPPREAREDYLLNPELPPAGTNPPSVRHEEPAARPQDHPASPPGTGRGNPVIDMLIKAGSIPLSRLLPAMTVKPAAWMKMDELGSIEPGRKPGLNLISGVDLETLQTGRQAVLKKLV